MHIIRICRLDVNEYHTIQERKKRRERKRREVVCENIK